MKKSILFICFLSVALFINAQTYSWSGFPNGGTSYVTGIMTATVTSSAPGSQYGTPKYYSSATVGSGQCGIAGGLGLEQMFGNVTSAHITVRLDFTNGLTQNGTCASMQFQIHDINADESNATFRDFVHISATDESNAAIPVANITATGGSNKAITTSGGTTRIIAGSTGTYGSRSTTACDNVTITVTPPVGVPLRTITIRYQPSYEAASATTGYWNFSGPYRPAYQYISIGSIVATPVGGGCVVLPAELIAFTGNCKDKTKKLLWSTYTETNNDYFEIETLDSENEFISIGKVSGSGNSNVLRNYEYEIENTSFNYYRLKQTDFNGTYKYSEILHLDCGTENTISVYPNPASEYIFIQTDKESENLEWMIYDYNGKMILTGKVYDENSLVHKIDIADLPKGIYFIIVSDGGNFREEMKWVKE